MQVPSAFAMRAPIARGELTMDQPITDAAQTSTAATSGTEPEVVAAISSAEGGPDLPTSFHIGGIEFPYGRTVLLVAGGLAVGDGLSRRLGGAPRWKTHLSARNSRLSVVSARWHQPAR